MRAGARQQRPVHPSTALTSFVQIRTSVVGDLIGKVRVAETRRRSEVLYERPQTPCSKAKERFRRLLSSASQPPLQPSLAKAPAGVLEPAGAQAVQAPRP